MLAIRRAPYHCWNLAGGQVFVLDSSRGQNPGVVVIFDLAGESRLTKVLRNEAKVDSIWLSLFADG
jgi:hypothetical protein